MKACVAKVLHSDGQGGSVVARGARARALRRDRLGQGFWGALLLEVFYGLLVDLP